MQLGLLLRDEVFYLQCGQAFWGTTRKLAYLAHLDSLGCFKSHGGTVTLYWYRTCFEMIFIKDEVSSVWLAVCVSTHGHKKITMPMLHSIGQCKMLRFYHAFSTKWDKLYVHGQLYKVGYVLYSVLACSAEFVILVSVLKMVVDVYGHISSAPSRLVLMTCETLGLDYNFKKVDILTGEHKQEAYTKVSIFTN